jgi:hypothetical protein
MILVWILLALQEHHHHEGMQMPAPTEAMGEMQMRHASGTSWEPDTTPIRGIHFMPSDWRLMVHWNFFFGYDAQGGNRGDNQWVGIGWAMVFAQHVFAGGDFGVRLMMTPEPATVTKQGYPLLLQTGEEVNGVALHDRQHPHDLFMEAAVMYQHPLGRGLAFEFYGGPVGEPAIGPTAFPHRYSASSDPLAVLSHHWQDSTHIAFGVVTMGVFTQTLKIEGSWFNGREPDADRYDFDTRALDSASGRVQWNPTAETSFQASYAFLDSPEELEPQVSQQRITASAMFTRRLESGGIIASTLVWGRVIPSDADATDSLVLEANYDVDGSNIFFGRAEYVRKYGTDLDLASPDNLRSYPIGSVALGYVRQLPLMGPLQFGVGARGAVGFVGDVLSRPMYYGTSTPIGGILFVQLQPPLAQHHH